jgi:transcriptional/translational regulatory protein YebC/TACO1
LFTVAESCGNANIKAWEDLNKQAVSIAYQEKAVVEREQELQEKEEEVTSMLDRGLSELSSREADLGNHGTALEANRKSLGDMHAEVLTYKLTTDLKANHLAFKEKELADMEKQLAMVQPRELPAAWKRLEEL